MTKARLLWRSIPALTLLSLSLSATNAFADKAVVAGVNEYPKLHGATLGGCVNDAKSIADALKEKGFEVTLLMNEEATQKGILGTLANMKKKCKSNERFVFYFAGHGALAPDGSSVLLPNDANDGASDSDLTREAVYNAITAIPATSRSVLLDSCFSGGLTKSLGRKVKKTRFYLRGNPKAAPTKRDLQANGNDNNAHIAGSGAAACYFTASLGNQTSGEDDFEGVRDGVFTHFLLTKIKGMGAGATWGEVQKEVTGQVADYMEQTQTPKLSPSTFCDLPIFGEKKGADPEPTPAPTPAPNQNLWDAFNEDRSDASLLELVMRPNKTVVKIKEQFVFEAKIGNQSGFLVLLDRDVDGKVYLLYPNSGNVEDSKVEGNSTVRLPANAGSKYDADTAGQERVKAILFSSEDAAKKLLNAFPKEGATMRRLRETPISASAQKPVVTAGLVFSVEK